MNDSPDPDYPWRERALAAESEVADLRRMLVAHAELTATAHRQGPQRFLKLLLLTRKELRACREFIESIASGRMKPTVSDARYFLAGVDAERKAKGGGQ